MSSGLSQLENCSEANYTKILELIVLLLCVCVCVTYNTTSFLKALHFDGSDPVIDVL